jgi:hypothetical protein
LRAVKGFDVYYLVITTEICLVPNVMVPMKFRVPELVKYMGLECHNMHLRSYYNKMAEVIRNEELLIHFFQDSWTGSALSWYMTLNNTRVKKWSDLVNDFLQQYKFNIDIALDHMSLMGMEKSNKETVREYTHEWKNKGNACTTTFVGEKDGDSIH